MQALNLRPEPVAPKIESVDQRASQGVSRSNQDESSFEVALKKAQKELDESSSSEKKLESEQTSTKPKEGNSNNIPQEDEAKVSLQKLQDSELKLSFDLEKLVDSKENLVKLEEPNVVHELEDFTLNLEEYLSKSLNFSQESQDSENSENTIKLDVDSKNIDIENLVFNLNENNENLQLDETLKIENEENFSENDSSLELLLTGLNENSESVKNPVIQDFTNLSQENVTEFSAKFAKNEKQENSKPIISVVDERTITTEAKEQGNFVTTITQTGDNSAQMSMNLSANVQQNIQFEGIVNSNASQSTNFSAMLSSEIQNNAYEFVKAGSMVLKDNNSGTINLILHPDELGSVKIQLELSDKLIAGKIVVATKEAYEAFRSSMGALKDAFNMSGFESSNFDLSWSGQESSSSSEDNRNFHGLAYEKNLPEFIEDSSYGIELVRDTIMYGSSLINMMA